MLYIILLIVIAVLCYIIIRAGERIYRYGALLNIASIWIFALIYGKDMAMFFHANNVKKVGLIGQSVFAYVLVQALKQSGLEVVLCEKQTSPIPGVDIVDKINSCDMLIDLDVVDSVRGNQIKRTVEGFNGNVVGLHDLIMYTNELAPTR